MFSLEVALTPQNKNEGGIASNGNPFWSPENNGNRMKLIHAMLGYSNDIRKGKVSNEGHTALTLTTCLPTKSDLEQMGQECLNGYKLILARFISNFYTQPIIEETIVTMECAGYLFRMSGERIIEKGFLAFESRNILEPLPTFTVGQVVDATFEIAERQTNPPKKVTVKELLEYLKNPYQKELKAIDPNDDTEYYRLLKEGVSLGTEATVDGIIANAIKEGYITSKKKSYSIGTRGIVLALLGEAIGVGFFKGEYDCPFDTANCYININRLMKIWDIYSPAKCLEELDLLKKWGILNYSFGVDVNRHRQIRVYIKFKMFTQYLCNNITSRESKGYQEQRYNINSFDGYFWVNAEQMVDFFFEKHKYPHGIKDLAALLYFNISFGDKMCPYEELRYHPIVTFGKMCGVDREKKDPDNLVVAPNYYIKQQNLADFLKIPISAARNMVQRLVREGLIHTKYIRNKGMCIIFRCQENSNVEEVFENIQKAIHFTTEIC